MLKNARRVKVAPVTRQPYPAQISPVNKQVRTETARKRKASGGTTQVSADGMQGTYQLSLLSELDGGGCSKRAMHMAGLMPSLKSCMQRSLAAAVPPLSREQLVDRMNAIAKQYGLKITVGRGRVLTLAVLEKWLAPNDMEDMPPIAAFQVFMLALGNFEPLRMLAEFNGCKLVTEEELPYFEYGKAKFEARERSRQLKRLEDTLSDRHKAGR